MRMRSCWNESKGGKARGSWRERQRRLRASSSLDARTNRLSGSRVSASRFEATCAPIYPVLPGSRMATLGGGEGGGGGIASRCAGGARFGARRERHVTSRSSFHGTSFNQRIAPLAQRRNVDVDPVVPPVQGAGVVAEGFALLGRQVGAEALDIGGFKDVVVLEDERLEERDELDHFIQVAFLAGQRSTGEAQGFDALVDSLHDHFLRRGRESLVAGFRDRDGVEFQADQVLEVVARAVILSVAQTGELDRSAHVAGVRYGCGEMVDAVVAAGDERGGDERHAPGDDVYRDQVQRFVFVGRELTEESAQEVGKRGGGVYAFIPAYERLFDRRFDDGRSDDGDGGFGICVGIAADHRFRKAFRERVGVGPAEFVGALGSSVHQRLTEPTRAVLADLVFERDTF